jgi:predicted RNase H-like HicB family nuclease
LNKHLIDAQRKETGSTAFSPDVPGCGSTGTTEDAVERNIQYAMEFRLEGLRREGVELPEPSSYSSSVRIAASPATTVKNMTRPLAGYTPAVLRHLKECNSE